MIVKIGTRKSKLALIQTHIAIEKLKNIDKTLKFEIHEITTTGDVLYKEDLSKVGGKGLFVKEIEEELLKGNIDIAVHSMKDVPVYSPDDLVIDCVLNREDPRDALISKGYKTLQSLPKNATIGTSSLRRKLQVLEYRADLQVLPLRGNVTTRVDKVLNGQLDACILAYAGIKRLGLEEQVAQIFTVEEFLPAISQGTIGIERRRDNHNIVSILRKINDQDTFLCTQAERSFMETMQGGCTTPFAAYAVKVGDDLHLKAKYFDESNKTSFVTEVNGKAISFAELGRKAALDIKKHIG